MRAFSLFVFAVSVIIQHGLADSIAYPSNQPMITAPYASPWKPLTNDEVKGVIGSLKVYLNGTTDLLYINRPETFFPLKTEVLAAWDTTYTPPRYAKARASFIGYDQEYIIGPIPAWSATDTNSISPPIRTLTNRLLKSQSQASQLNTTFSDPRDVPLPPGNEWETDRQGPSFPLEDLPPPKPTSQGTPRFVIDITNNFIAWADFSFYYTTLFAQGVSLFDIRWANETIMYELALQEALAHYAGADQHAATRLYFDAALAGMGNSMNALVRGYDCPDYATFLDVTLETGQVRTQALCVFEFDTGVPMRRHFDPQRGNVTSVTKNVVLTMRWVATIGNYDYLFDYTFALDGSVDVSVRASGHVIPALEEGGLAAEYGYKIVEGGWGSLHDHVVTFKVDLDIKGVRNSLAKVEVVPATIEYPWAPSYPMNTMRLAKSFITNENDASIDWSANDAAMYSFVNKNASNKLGEYPGYRFRRTSGTAHFTPLDSTLGGRAIQYATRDFFVTRQHDNETVAAVPQNSQDTDNPVLDFAAFLNGEGLEQEDIVLWINLGMHHAPHSSDLPNTLFYAAHSSVRFEPVNYFDVSPVRRSAWQAKLWHGNGTVSESQVGAR